MEHAENRKEYLKSKLMDCDNKEFVEWMIDCIIEIEENLKK